MSLVLKEHSSDQSRYSKALSNYYLPAPRLLSLLFFLLPVRSLRLCGSFIHTLWVGKAIFCLITPFAPEEYLINLSSG